MQHHHLCPAVRSPTHPDTAVGSGALDALADRVEAALVGTTPGEWKQIVADDAKLLDIMNQEAAAVDDRIAGLIYVREGGAYGLGKTLLTVNGRRATIDADDANARAIVALHNLAPEIVATLRAREAEIARLTNALGEIAYMRPVGDVDTARSPRKLVERMEKAALRALARPSSTPSDGDGA
jgi:hypothetical protein